MTPRTIGSSEQVTSLNKIPVIRSLKVSPIGIDTPPCGPSTRPTVTARVTDADDAPSSLNVRLHYHFGSLYQGEVRMTYNAGATAFTYQLPAFEQKHNPDGEAGTISVGIVVTDSTGEGPRPFHGAYVMVNSCIIVSNG